MSAVTPTERTPQMRGSWSLSRVSTVAISLFQETVVDPLGWDVRSSLGFGMKSLPFCPQAQLRLMVNRRVSFRAFSLLAYCRFVPRRWLALGEVIDVRRDLERRVHGFMRRRRRRRVRGRRHV